MFLGGLCFSYCISEYKKNAQAFFFSTNKNDIKKRSKTLQYNANDPIEDRVVSGSFKDIKGYVTAVIDGHGGYQNAEFISSNLIEYVEDNIKKEMRNSNNETSESDVIKSKFSKLYKIYRKR